MRKIVLADNALFLPTINSSSIDLIYIDPPFNTGKKRETRQLCCVRDDVDGDRHGFQGKYYKSVEIGRKSFNDSFDNYYLFLKPRLKEAYRVLSSKGSFFFHIDYHEVHYCKILLDCVFGRECFMNEIVWAYDFGARSRKKWSAKHSIILWYAKDPDNYVFNFDEMDRIPYMAPGLVSTEKAIRGKTPTDCWWHTIVPTNSREKTGYPTQKPVGVLNRIVKVHSRPGDLLLDFFAGSGTLGEVAFNLGRDFILVDNNREAVEVMLDRLALAKPEFVDLICENNCF